MYMSERFGALMPDRGQDSINALLGLQIVMHGDRKSVVGCGRVSASPKAL